MFVTYIYIYNIRCVYIYIYIYIYICDTVRYRSARQRDMPYRSATKNNSFCASLRPAVLQHKLLCSPRFGVFQLKFTQRVFFS